MREFVDKIPISALILLAADDLIDVAKQHDSCAWYNWKKRVCVLYCRVREDLECFILQRKTAKVQVNIVNINKSKNNR